MCLFNWHSWRMYTLTESPQRHFNVIITHNGFYSDCIIINLLGLIFSVFSFKNIHIWHYSTTTLNFDCQYHLEIIIFLPALYESCPKVFNLLLLDIIDVIGHPRSSALHETPCKYTKLCSCDRIYCFQLSYKSNLYNNVSVSHAYFVNNIKETGLQAIAGRNNTQGYHQYSVTDLRITSTNLCWCTINRKLLKRYVRYLHVGIEYKKRLLLRCIKHFKLDLINKMDHMYGTPKSQKVEKLGFTVVN